MSDSPSTWQRFRRAEERAAAREERARRRKAATTAGETTEARQSREVVERALAEGLAERLRAREEKANALVGAIASLDVKSEPGKLMLEAIRKLPSPSPATVAAAEQLRRSARRGLESMTFQAKPFIAAVHRPREFVPAPFQLVEYRPRPFVEYAFNFNAPAGPNAGVVIAVRRDFQRRILKVAGGKVPGSAIVCLVGGALLGVVTAVDVASRLVSPGILPFLNVFAVLGGGMVLTLVLIVIGSRLARGAEEQWQKVRDELQKRTEQEAEGIARKAYLDAEKQRHAEFNKTQVRASRVHHINEARRRQAHDKQELELRKQLQADEGVRRAAFDAEQSEARRQHEAAEMARRREFETTHEAARAEVTWARRLVQGSEPVMQRMLEAFLPSEDLPLPSLVAARVDGPGAVDLGFFAPDWGGLAGQSPDELTGSYRQLVAGTALRHAGDVLAYLPTVNTVRVDGWEMRPDPATGAQRHACVLAVVIKRGLLDGAPLGEGDAESIVKQRFGGALEWSAEAMGYVEQEPGSKITPDDLVAAANVADEEDGVAPDPGMGSTGSDPLAQPGEPLTASDDNAR